MSLTGSLGGGGVGTGSSLLTGGGPGLVTWLNRAPTISPTVTPVSTPVITGQDPNEIANATLGKKIPIFVGGLARIGTAGIVYGPNISSNTGSWGASFGFAANVTGTRRVEEIAFDSKVAWTLADGFVSEAFTFRFYQGTLTQAADALEVAEFGSSNAVAYRGQMLLFIENLPLAQFNNRIPYVAIKIGDTTAGATPSDGINLGEALERLAYSPWVGYTANEFETDGITDIADAMIVAEDTSFLELVQNLNRIYRSWDILQTDKLRVVDRGSNVTPDIVFDRTRIVADGPSVTFARQQQESLPRELELITPDPGADYVLVPSKAQRPTDPVAVTSSMGKETVTLPVVIDATTRMGLVTYAKYAEEQARKKVEFKAMAYGFELEPGDLFKLENIADGIDDEVFKVIETLHTGDWQVEVVGEGILRCALASAGSGEHVQCYNDSFAGTTTNTFAGADLGVPNAERRIVVALNLTLAATGQTIDGVTINGVAATEAAVASNTGQGLISAIWYAHVPTGATGDVVVTTSGNMTEMSAHVYRLVSSTFALDDTDSDEATTSSAVTVNVDIPANGIAIAAASTRTGSEFSWSGAAADCTFATDVDTTGQRSSASYQTATAETAFAIAVDPDSIDRVTIAVASFAL